jgi:hypothetical protein
MALGEYHIITRLEKDLQIYEKIIIVGKNVNLLKLLPITVDLKNIIIYLDKDIELPIGIVYRHLPTRDINKLLKLYNTYEFSDRVCVLSDSVQYGTLQNYVDTGMLTETEALKTLLS